MIGLIEFNKLIRLKGFTRILKGKRIRVKPHTRKIRSLLDDLPKPPMKPKVKKGDISAFQTEKGSIYMVGPSSFGPGYSSTLRYKTPHPGHPVSDVGWRKTPSIVTLFIDPKNAKQVGMWQSLVAESKRIYVTNKSVILTSVNGVTRKRGSDVKFEYSPKYTPNSAPLELDHMVSDGTNTWFKGNHPGNIVTKVERQR